MEKSGLKRFLRSLKWTPMPLALGFGLIGYLQYRHTCKREARRIALSDPVESLAGAWEVSCYKFLPLKAFSRSWGWVTGIELPEWSRKPLIGYYVKKFGCNMGEAEIEDLQQYSCLSDLFKRRLKSNARPVDPFCSAVSPADGTILSAGKVNCGFMEQVKGVSYSAKKFLGPNRWTLRGPSIVLTSDGEDCYHKACLKNPQNNDLYQVIIYLAPGDYHRFHSPADWSVFFRRHFPGELLSVNPSIVSWIKNLFIINERVTYVGSWLWGFFSMTAVGATSVGSIVVPFDSKLKTNSKLKIKYQFLDNFFRPKEICMKKGDDFGQFNLGSTIVLIFEAPKELKLCVQTGQRVLVGQPLLQCLENSKRINEN